MINILIYRDKDEREYKIISEEGEIKELSEVYCSYRKERILNNRYKSYDSEEHKFKEE